MGSDAPAGNAMEEGGSRETGKAFAAAVAPKIGPMHPGANGRGLRALLVQNGSESGGGGSNHEPAYSAVATPSSTHYSAKVTRLVARPLHSDDFAMALFQSLADRAWFAWNCLPRDERGDRPKIRELERSYGLTNGSLHRLINGISVRPGYEQIVKMAAALNTTAEWLQLEKGAAPTTSWPVPPRPARIAREASPAASEVGVADQRAHREKADRLMQGRKPVSPRKARK
jgi:hypothetical protein